MNSNAAPSAPSHTHLMRKLAVYGLFAVFAVWCVTAFRKDIAQVDPSQLQAGWGAVLLAGGLSLVNYALRVWRWRLYMTRLGHSLPWRFVALTYMAGFAFTLSPGKIGEMVRARYYQPHGIGLPASGAAFFVERLLDLLAMMLLTAAALTELQAYQRFLWVALALVGGLLAMLMLLPWPRVAAHLDQRAAHRLLRPAQAIVHTLVRARALLSPGILLGGMALGLAAWALEAIGLKLVADVVSPEPLAMASAMGIYAVAIIVGALSFLPGGLGSTEFVMAGLLYAHGFTMPQAILLTLVCRLLTLWLAVVIGWYCVWVLRHTKQT